MKSVLVLLGICLLLTSCTGSFATPQIRENFQTGGDGISVSFFDENIDSGVQEGGRFDLVIDVHNQGAYYSPATFINLEVDDAYVQIEGPRTKQIDMYGRSNDYPTGELQTIIFPAQAKALDISSLEHQTIVFATVCYEYQTEFNKNVCIDTDPYNRDFNSQEKSCTRADLTGSSQGGPIAVTRVEVQTYQQTESVYLPQFTVTVKNLQRGLVFYPGQVQALCGSVGLDNQRVNEVRIDATLSDVELKCGSDNVVIMNGNEGKITCGLIGNDGLAVPIDNRLPSYEAPLHIKLNYGYSDTVNQQFSITRFA